MPTWNPQRYITLLATKGQGPLTCCCLPRSTVCVCVLCPFFFPPPREEKTRRENVAGRKTRDIEKLLAPVFSFFIIYKSIVSRKNMECSFFFFFKLFRVLVRAVQAVWNNNKTLTFSCSSPTSRQFILTQRRESATTIGQFYDCAFHLAKIRGRRVPECAWNWSRARAVRRIASLYTATIESTRETSCQQETGYWSRKIIGLVFFFLSTWTKQQHESKSGGLRALDRCKKET